MIDQNLNIACFTLIVNALLNKQGQPEKLHEVNDWTSFVRTWGPEVGLERELLEDLVNERYFLDADFFFQRVKEKIASGASSTDILLWVSMESSKHISYPMPLKGIAQSCASHLSSYVQDTKTSILCCGFAAMPVVMSLLTYGLKVDWYFPVRDPIGSVLLHFLPMICGAGHLTISSLEDRVGPLAMHHAFVLPRGYEVGLYILPNFGDLPIDRYTATELANTSMILHHAEILWSRKPGYENFRQELIYRNLLESVLLLPQGIRNFSGMQMAALTLQKERQSNNVLFVDLSSERLNKRDSDWQIPFSSLSKSGVSVSIQSLTKTPGCLLDVKRQLMAGSKELQIMTSGEWLPLEELVSITRAQSIREGDASETCVTVKEVLASDIDELGLIQEPQKTIRVGQKGASRAMNAWLKQGDILIAIKGSVGKVGFVPDALSDMNDNSDTKNKWVAGQSFVKLRIKPNQVGRLTPEYLFRYLKSRQVKEYLASRSIGVIPMIKMADIEALPVKLPSIETLEAENARYNRQLIITQEIQRLKQELKNLELDLSTLS